LALGLGLSACAAPPRIDHTSAARGGAPPASATTAAVDPETQARSWLKTDHAVRRTQAASTDLGALPIAPAPAITGDPDTSPALGGQSLSLQMALYGALTSNPDLVTLRQGSPIANAPSPEAVEVARRFPTTLNPTIWIDYRPITLIPPDTFGTTTGAPKHGGFYHYGQNFILMSYRQPMELGHQTTHRYHIAKAALDQQQWTVTQAELTALVQTYRFFQTAAYRREKLKVASDLANFNDRLLGSLQKRAEINQSAAADVILARVESRSARQQVQAARQDYLTALTDLRNQIGLPGTGGTIEPLGEFTLPSYIPPVDETVMVNEALANRPDIHAAQAQIRGAQAAVRLAKGDRLPTQVIGPQYAQDEAGIQYVGLIWVTPLPILNSGKPLVAQREAEARRACMALQQAEQRAVAQVRAGVVRWNGATELVNETGGLAGELAGEVARLERLFDEGQTDLTKLMQARQRLIQLENSRLDAVWAATQAQADLLLALGTPTLINGMLARAEADAGLPVAAPPAAPPPPPPTPPAASTR
jgi:cobalt-zinc-cadmium efflux system outer membrane protein